MYFRNTKRLFRLIDDGDIPLSGSWLAKEDLMTKFKKLPLTQRRTLSVAAVKAGQVYNNKPAEKWNTQMYKSQSEYTDQRNKNEKSDKEKNIWPKDGFKSIKKAATEQKRRIRHILKDDPTISGLYRYGLFIVLKLFTELPFRNTFADMKVSESKDVPKGNEEGSKAPHAQGNYIEVPKKGNVVFHMRQYKYSKQLGEKNITLGRANTIQIKKILKYREAAGVKHDYLLSTTTGARMSRATLGKALHKVTKELLGKSFGSRLIRVLAATASKPEIDKATEIAEKMLHGVKQSKQYTRK